LGLLGLGACFTAIGLFCSSVTRNQIVRFLLGLFLCFFLYMGLDFLSRMPGFVGKYDFVIEQVGLMAHFESISRGVVDTRDILYFLSVILFFNLLTKTALASRKW
jgi:ABC-2 type transport system permease protein